MKNKTFINAFDKILPSENEKKKILEDILNKKNKKTSFKKSNLQIVIIAAAIFLVIFTFNKKDKMNILSLPKARITSYEELPSFVYEEFIYVRSDSSSNQSNNNENDNSLISESSLEVSDSNNVDSISILNKEFLGEYLFTIEDSSNILFGAKVYKSTKDENTLILFLNGVYEKYQKNNNE